MSKNLLKSAVTVVLLAVLALTLATPAQAGSVNKSVHIAAGDTSNGESSVNGSISVGNGAIVSGDLSTVNGAIEVAENVNVDGQIEAVNGRIHVDKGSKVARDVSNVNGGITLRASTVGHNISTVSGDIDLSDGAEVMGDIIVEKSHGWGWNGKNSRVPEVVIGPGSRVHGDIRVERVVKLYISDSAEVGGVTGELSMSDAIRFSGDRP